MERTYTTVDVNIGKMKPVAARSTGHVLNFSACDNDGPNGTKVWYDVSIWGPLADQAALELHTGDWIRITGIVRDETWTDRNGETRVSKRFKLCEKYKIHTTKEDKLARRMEEQAECSLLAETSIHGTMPGMEDPEQYVLSEPEPIPEIPELPF